MITLVPGLIGQTEAARDAERVSDRSIANEMERARPHQDASRGSSGRTGGPHGPTLYEFLRDRDARASWGTGAVASVTMGLGDQDGRSNPVSISIYRRRVAINFDFVRDKRTTDEMQRRPRVRRHAIRSRPARCIRGKQRSRCRYRVPCIWALLRRVDPPTGRCSCLIAIATVLELGPMASRAARTSCPCIGCAGFGRVALLSGAKATKIDGFRERVARTPGSSSNASAHHSGALRRRVETRCRVTPKRSAICSIVRPSA